MLKVFEAFSGIGAQAMAIRNLGVDYEVVAISEIDKYAIKAYEAIHGPTRNLGDISKINGAEIEPVDVISFGSPCQDLSVAGKRAGLKHEANGDEETTRSGLFMEAVRIIKEMRDATNGKYPRIALWENVPGAFSSNKGEDFRVVLEELIKIVEPSALMPEVPKSGWPYADSYCGNGWSIAYRVLDAQYIRTAQRRRRVFLVLDLGGECAREILFERESLRGYFAEGGSPWESFAAYAEGSSGIHDSSVNDSAITFEPGIAAREGGHIYERVSGTLRANMGENQMAVAYADVVLETAGFCTEHSAKSRGIGYE
jgi:DNA (cytosine-5)-methyltransferase 1